MDPVVLSTLTSVGHSSIFFSLNLLMALSWEHVKFAICLELLGPNALCFQATSGPPLDVPISLLLLVSHPQLMQLMQVLQLL